MKCKLLTQVTGGAGFIGSHLVDDLILDGNDVIVIDNFASGRKSNIKKWLDHPNFEFIHHDIVNPIWLEGTFNRLTSLVISTEYFHFSESDLSFGITSITTRLHEKPD